MIGVFINGYKSYGKATYIPITENTEEKFSAYIGSNGVGKSAILEALDVFFNNRSWNVFRGATREEIYIAPSLLIKKEIFDDRAVNSNYYNVTEIIENRKVLSDLKLASDFIWGNYNSLQGAARRDHIKRFEEAVDQLKLIVDPNDYYLLTLGVLFNGKTQVGPYENLARNQLKWTGDYEKRLNAIKKLVLEYYDYVYIPVEQNAEEVLKVEARQMQTLMNRDVLDEVDNVLNLKIDINGREKSFITFFNEYLNNFMDGINKTIQTIDSEYNYGTELFSRKNLTASDIREKILEAYFSKRTLRHKNREINTLSSGEQRKALIDIAYSFLSNMGDKDREIILAIDEPEVSMNIGNCFVQFERLEELANRYGNQVLITTHWYGFLPTTNKGYLFHVGVSDTEHIKKFNFYNYMEERRNFPDDIELKSMFDLASSILSYMKATESRWIICEGSDDKIYLQSIMKGEETNIRVLPVGGCGNVVKLFNLISNPITLEKTEKSTVKGKILCLIDTDEHKLNFIGSSGSDNLIELRRLQIVKVDGRSVPSFVDPYRQGELYEKTEMEDCLNPAAYFEAIHRVINEFGDPSIQDVISNYKLNELTTTSKVAGDDSILEVTHIDYLRRKREIVDYLSDNQIKYKVAHEYTKVCSEKEVEHQLLFELKDFFGIASEAPKSSK